MKRRDFLKGSLLLFGFGGCASLRHSNPTAGGFAGGPDHHSGHLLRERSVPLPTEKRRIRTAILGSGISGLSAAWQLNRSGWKGAELFELEAEPGGNSRHASYPQSKAPWAAHYLPVPTEESVAVRALLQEMGLMTVEPGGQVTYDERHLCHPQQERLWYRERWHDSLVPGKALSPIELEQWNDFRAEIDHWQSHRGADGKKAFALPLAYSSEDQELLELDKMTFAEYAGQKGWTSEFMQWLLEYATRDDYGAGLKQVSAWAGIHYFASRDGGGFRDDDALFVWPEGNGRLVDYLKSALPYPIRSRNLVMRVRPGKTVLIDMFNLSTQKMIQIEADQCVYCLPAFQRHFHLADEPEFGLHHAPWVTANLVLKSAPVEKSEFSEPAWDNVIYGSSSLGYVVATHQSKARANEGPNVWTWYRSFPNEDPARVRQRLLDSRWEFWKDEILQDLQTVHENIRDVVERIDVALFGHGMIVPTPGTVWGKELERARKPLPNTWFAHADLSGISIFEEAQYRGVLAAEQMMDAAGHPYRSLTSA